MKTFLAIVLFAYSALSRADPVKLAWTYPAAELTYILNGQTNNVVFRIYTSPIITTPSTNWTVLATTTNITATVNVTRGVNFFAVTASNFWEESFFSTVVATPAAPRTDSIITLSKP